MSRPRYPGCYCPITNWTDLKMFIAHWQAYHIDQLPSRIVCEHEKDGNLCQYMTDPEIQEIQTLILTRNLRKGSNQLLRKHRLFRKILVFKYLK